MEGKPARKADPLMSSMKRETHSFLTKRRKQSTLTSAVGPGSSWLGSEAPDGQRAGTPPQVQQAETLSLLLDMSSTKPRTSILPCSSPIPGVGEPEQPFKNRP